jgi:hypothetical protein
MLTSTIRMGCTFVMFVAAPGNYLIEFFLGYEDDGYGDNGYYSHDNGTGNQCLDVGNAWVNVTLIHP